MSHYNDRYTLYTLKENVYAQNKYLLQNIGKTKTIRISHINGTVASAC